jgi:hypothetical protein
MSILKPASEFIVAVGKYVGLDGHEIAGDALHSEAPSIDLRRYAFDYDAAQGLIRVRSCAYSSFHAL